MAIVEYTGQAQAVKQLDELAFTGVWAAADQAWVEINSKRITVTGGSTADTAAEYAAILIEAINRTSDEAYVLDYTANAGGQDFGEFRDVEAYVDPDDSTKIFVASVTPGVDFTMTSGVSTAGTGGITQDDEWQPATGPGDVDSIDNYSNAATPSDGDTVIVRKGSFSLTLNLHLVADSVNWQFKDTWFGSVGHNRINSTHTGYSYTEYRTRYLTVEPTATTGTTAIVVDSSTSGGSMRFDLGSNTPASTTLVTVRNTRAATTDGAAVQIVGGDDVDVRAFGGSVSIGVEPDENATTDLGRVDALEGGVGTSTTSPTIEIGEFCTFATGSGHGIDCSAGQVTQDCAAGTSNVLNAYGGNVQVTENGTAITANAYGGSIDWRGSVLTTLTVFDGGEFDATRCPTTTITNNVELHSGATFRDPNFVTGAVLDFNGCTPNDVTLELRPHLRHTLATL